MNMFKSITLILFLFLSFNVFSETTVRPSESYNVRVGNGGLNQMIVDIPSSEPTSSSYPVKAYIGMENDVGGQKNYITYSATDTIPTISASDTSTISVDIIMTNTDTERYVYLAVRKSESNSTYRLTGGPQYSIVSTNSPLSASCTFSIKEIFEQSDKSLSAGSSNEVYLMLYFYITDDNTLEKDDEIVPSGTDGMYYKLHFSDKIPSGRLDVISLEKGDGRLKIEFIEGVTVTEMGSTEAYRTLIIQRAGTVLSNGGDSYYSVINAGGSLFEEYGFIKDGYLDIYPLVNYREYNFSVALMNKYQFTTALSNSMVESPESIEVFLKKQSCYLFSAGFQREHFVLDYFRRFRDTVLLRYQFGKAFIAWYYNTAPGYAPYIYRSEGLSFIVRTVGYALFYLMNYFYFFFLAVFLLAYKFVLKFR
ncbi:MAG: hypothetical protein KAQ98_08565 [Bacteriovoracaceae bacterium]|nr:hypothetical protein [Bacteriovoracaceae bacterium]